MASFGGLCTVPATRGHSPHMTRKSELLPQPFCAHDRTEAHGEAGQRSSDSPQRQPRQGHGAGEKGTSGVCPLPFTPVRVQRLLVYII